MGGERKTDRISVTVVVYDNRQIKSIALMISFHTNHVSVTREDWGELVFFGDESSEQYLMLQAADSYDDQDVSLGMDDIYIEICGQGWSWYGNIEVFKLRRDRVFVQLSPEAANEMRDDGKVEATFELDKTEYARLRKTLQKIFEGKEYFRDGSA
jgi:immunity protein 10 of polymorphic toxin system